MCDVSFTNNIAVICQNPKMTAINSCIAVDLTGQVCSDSIGERMYSGKYMWHCSERMYSGKYMWHCSERMYSC